MQRKKNRIELKVQTGVFKSYEWYFYLICMLLEVVGIGLVGYTYNSICIQAYEMSAPVMLFIICNVTLFLQDIVYVFLVMCFSDVGREPLSIMYNLVMGLVSTAISVCLIVLMTYCGNVAQFIILAAGVCGTLAGVIHIINGCLGHWFLPKEEL